MKPKPDIILQALSDYEIDLESSFYCGYRQADYLLAKSFDLPFYGINYTRKEKVLNFKNLFEVSEYIDKNSN